MKAFEIHTFSGGKWKIDSIFDDRDLALFEAQRMENSKRYAGVRVVEELFDEQSQQTLTRTIYKGTCLDQAAVMEEPRKPQSSARPGRPAPGKGGSGRRVGQARPAQKPGSSSTGLAIVFGIIVVVGTLLLIGLRYFADRG